MYYRVLILTMYLKPNIVHCKQKDEKFLFRLIIEKFNNNIVIFRV